MHSGMRLIVCAALALGLFGCGASSSATHSTSAGSASSASIASASSGSQTAGSATVSSGAQTAGSATGSSGTSASARATWATQTQQLCREKLAAIVRLGYIQITYAGIQRVGLPSAERLLDRYLGRLLAVLRGFYARQETVATPPPLSATMASAREIELLSQLETQRLSRQIASARTATAFHDAFQAWLLTAQSLAVRGDAVAGQLDLPACRSGALGVGDWTAS